MNIEQSLKNLSMAQALMVSVFLMVIVYFVFYDDGSTYVQRANAERQKLTKLNQEIASLQKLANDARAKKQTKEQLTKELEQIINFIPTDFSNAQMMKMVSEKAKEAGMNISNINGTRVNNARSEQDYLNQVSVKVSLDGTFSQVMLFLSYLTRVNKVITISDFKMNAGKAEPGAVPQVRFDATLLGHRYVETAPSKGGR